MKRIRYLRLNGGHLYHVVESDLFYSSKSVAICGVRPGETKGHRRAGWFDEGDQATCRKCKDIMQARESNQQGTDSSKSSIEIRFTTRLTPHGCTVTMTTPVRTQTKRYRNGYGCAEISARRWIKEQIDGYREYEKECMTNGKESPTRLFFVNGSMVE